MNKKNNTVENSEKIVKILEYVVMYIKKISALISQIA